MLRLEEYRKLNGMSIRQLSISTGISRTYLSEIESGKYDNPGVLVICALCKQFKCTPNDMIPEEMYR